MIPWTHPSSKPKRHLDWFSWFCTAHRRLPLYFTMGRPFPLKIAPYHGDLPLSNMWFRVLTQEQPKRYLNRFIRLCGAHDCDRQTDRQRDRSTDHVTRSVTIGGIYIRSTVIRPKNGWTDRDAAWYLDSGEPKEPSIKCGSRSPQANGQFLDERICPGMPDDTFPWPVQKDAVWVVDSDVIYYVGCTLAPPVEYD